MTYTKYIYTQKEAIDAMYDAIDKLEKVKAFCDMNEYDYRDRINYSYSAASDELYGILKQLDELYGTIENAEEPEDPEERYM